MASTRLDQAGLRAPARFSLLAGGASYAIYLSHTLILLAVQTLGFNEFASGWAGAVTQVIYLLLTLAILAYSIAHYRWVERPLHGWFKRILRLGVLPQLVVLPGTQTRV
jgi:exopolysaccharide production protein ExoZ